MRARTSASMTINAMIKKGRRRGVSIVEAVILIVVGMVVIGGLFNSIGLSMRLRSHSQLDLDSYMTAHSLFEVLASLDPRTITNQSSLRTAVQTAISHLGGKVKGGKLYVRALQLTPTYVKEENGAKIIRLDVTMDGAGGSRTVAFTRGLSIYGRAGVPDRPYRRQLYDLP